MRIEPELDELIYGPRGVLKGITICLDQECLVSGITLIFSAIDSLSALTRPIEAPSTSRSVFINWVERFLLPDSGLACSAMDLYAARCGVLHTQSHESDLQRQGSARPLIYEWRLGPRADVETPLPPGALTLEVESLRDAFLRAVERFLVAADTETDMKHRVERHLKALLCYRPWPVLSGQVAA